MAKPVAAKGQPQERFFYDDPDAPAPNVALSPGVAAVIFDGDRRILIMKRNRSPYWSLPGGRIDMDESAQECCVRETLEETGLETSVVRLVACNTQPRSIVAYPDGNIHRSFVLCFEVRVVGGSLRVSDESEAFRWLGVDELDDVLLIPDTRFNALDAWASNPAAVIR